VKRKRKEKAFYLLFLKQGFLRITKGYQELPKVTKSYHRLPQLPVLTDHYRISRNSGRGSYPFVRQILPQNWVSAVLILGAVTIDLV